MIDVWIDILPYALYCSCKNRQFLPVAYSYDFHISLHSLILCYCLAFMIDIVHQTSGSGSAIMLI